MSMGFSYSAYRGLLERLAAKGYHFTDYHDCDAFQRCVILRHDVDLSPLKALIMAEIERGARVKSTYFFLLSTGFYNLASSDSLDIVRKIHEMGHDIGLHFDEKKYAEEDSANLNDELINERISDEAEIMEMITGVKIKAVSMHRPSKLLLSALALCQRNVAPAAGGFGIERGANNILINAYSAKFFSEFKYLSDSRRFWREDVIGIAESGDFDRLHILTHPFWYNEKERSMRDDILDFLGRAAGEHYERLKDNFRDLEDAVSETEVYGGDR